MNARIPPHVLVVDDDPQIRRLLEDYLTANEFRVTACASGRDMAATLAGTAVDLVILDLRLAGEDGMLLARRLREESNIPVIIVSGIRDEADRVMGLELGADDYLTKPFSPRELLARIRTVLRRARLAPSTQPGPAGIRAYRFASFELNVRTRRLTRQPDRRIDLSNGEFNLLAALLAAPQRVLTRDQLLVASHVHDNEVYDRSVDVQVLRLRRKIEADPAEPEFIVTERGVGYSFAAPVDVLY